MSWKAIATRKQASRDELLFSHAAHNGIVDTTLNSYTRATATEIVSRIKSREWTATQVLEAYIQRAIAAHAATNCITEVMFDSAKKEAQALDDEFARTGQLRGPLHGVPMSVKDMFHVKGTDTTIGFTNWADRPSKEDSELVTILRASGAIPFVKTNVPQTMLSFECSNPLFGRTANPHTSPLTGKRDFGPGGSSGGEAAILACDGSALGLGSDIGGSLRIPTGFCGVYALKPSGGRTSGRNTASAAPGFEHLTVCYGVMGRSPDDISLGSKVIFGKGHADIALPWNSKDETAMKEKNLRIGYYLSDEVVRASPACQRAVLASVEALRQAGHECVEFRPPNVLEAMRVFTSFLAADKYETMLSWLEGDPKEPSLFLPTLGPNLPSLIRLAAGFLLRKVFGDPIFATLLDNSRPRSIKEVYQLVEARDAYNDMWEREVWENEGFDFILCPVNASPAVPHGTPANLSPTAVATALYNVVDSPVGVIPVLRVDPKLDAAPSESWSATHAGSPILARALFEGSVVTGPKAYDPQHMEGLPVGIQIVGKRGEDEKVVGLMRILDDLLGKERGFGAGASSVYL